MGGTPGPEIFIDGLTLEGTYTLIQATSISGLRNYEGGDAFLVLSDSVSDLYSTGPTYVTAKQISNIHIVTTGDGHLSGYQSLRNAYVDVGQRFSLYLSSVAPAGDIIVDGCYFRMASGRSSFGILTIRDSFAADSFRVSNSTFVYTGGWTEPNLGGAPALFVQIGSDTSLYFDNVSFGTKDTPLPIIAIYHGSWNRANDAGVSTQDRYLSIRNCTFRTTFANTANPPENPVTPLYLMSRSDTGKPTYLIENNTFIFDAVNTQRLNRGMHAVAEVRGAGSGGANGSLTPVTGNTWAQFVNNTVHAKFSTEAVTLGGKGLIGIRSTPLFAEQDTMLVPIVDIDGLTFFSDGEEDHTIRTTSVAAGDALTMGVITGNSAVTIQSGTPTYRQTHTGTLTVAGNASVTGDIIGIGNIKKDPVASWWEDFSIYNFNGTASNGFFYHSNPRGVRTNGLTNFIFIPVSSKPGTVISGVRLHGIFDADATVRIDYATQLLVDAVPTIRGFYSVAGIGTGANQVITNTFTPYAVQTTEFDSLFIQITLPTALVGDRSYLWAYGLQYEAKAF